MRSFVVVVLLVAVVCGQNTPQQQFSFPFPMQAFPASFFPQSQNPLQPFGFPSPNQQQLMAQQHAFMNPMAMAFMQNPSVPFPSFPSNFAPIPSVAQAKVHSVRSHAGRPSAPDVSVTAGSDASSVAGASAGKEQSTNAVETKDQTTSKAEAQDTSLVQSYASTMLGSLQSLSRQSTAAAHQLFVPPYSWMWRVAMTLGSLKYDNMDRVADVPELMNLITGYFAGTPDAVAAAQANTPYDRFSLSNLSQLFQGPTSYSKTAAAPTYPYSSPSSYDPYSASAAGGDGDDALPAAYGASGSNSLYDDNDDENAPKDSGVMSNIMNAFAGGSKSSASSSYAAQAKPSTPSMMDMVGKMMSGQGSKGGLVSPDMIKMVGGMAGVNPTLLNMAAPMIGSMM